MKQHYQNLNDTKTIIDEELEEKKEKLREKVSLFRQRRKGHNIEELKETIEFVQLELQILESLIQEDTQFYKYQSDDAKVAKKELDTAQKELRKFIIDVDLYQKQIEREQKKYI